MSYFTELQKLTPEQITTQHLKEARGDRQLTKYFRQIIVATLGCKYIGDRLSAEELENRCMNTFSKFDRKII
jgi:hypothetical protein